MKRVSGLVTLAFALLALLTTLSAASAAPRPAKPNFARVKAVSPFELDLVWRDRANDADGFIIERSTNRMGFRQIAQVLPGTTVYRDKNLFPDTRYFYRIRAFNASGVSRYDSIYARTQTPVVPFSVADWGYPVGFVAPTNTDLVSVSPGAAHSLGLKKDGTVIAWGYEFLGGTIVPTNLNNVIAISAGYGFSLALKSDGTVVEWGNEGGGGRGNVGGGGGGFRNPSPPMIFPPPSLSIQPTNIIVGPPTSLSTDPILVEPISTNQPIQPILPPVIQPIQLNPQPQRLSSTPLTAQTQSSPTEGLTDVVAISAGDRHSLALKGDGTVVAWGFDDVGDTDVPPGLNGVVEIAAGQRHSLALRSDGTVVGWGGGISGAGTPPTNLTSVVAIAAGPDTSIAVKSDGTVVAWGAEASSTTTATSSLTDARAVALGGDESSALKRDGSLFSWVSGAASFTVPDFGASVVAISANGNHFAALSTAPAAPSNPSLTVLSANQLRFSWQDNSSDEKSFAIERATLLDGNLTPWTQIGTVGANHTHFTDTTVETNVTYSYRVRAIGKFGTSPYCMVIQALLAPLAPPQGLFITLNGTNQVTLAWYDGFSGIDGYKIERAPDENGTAGAWQEIASTTATNLFQNSFSDVAVETSNTYWYRVRAFNVLGISPYSDFISVAVTPPLVPNGLGYSPYGSNITVFWSANFHSPTPAGYKVESAPDINNAPGPWTEVTNAPSSVNSYTEFGLTIGETKWYRVRAYNWVGDSPYTPPFSVTLPPTPTPYALSGSAGLTPAIDLHWDSLQVDGFEVERAPDASGSPGDWTQIAVASNNFAPAFQGSFNDTNVLANATYWYRVRAFTVVGYSDYSTALPVTVTVPSAPSHLDLFMANGVQIYWAADPYVDLGFTVERAADASGEPGTWEQISTFTNTSPFSSTSFIDTNALPNTIYWYRMRAFNWIGFSDYSQPASIGTFPPVAPEQFNAQADQLTARLSWIEFLGNYGSFEIERAPDVGGIPGTWTLLANTYGNTQTYVDKSVTANTTYWYRLRASNWAGYSPYTDPLSITIAPPN